ncbi:MAG: hypothetical protein HYR55_14505 [Acidobacteria bacterium]|nr:hypothetical protein [Acidobacteriota bacterium]MBI3657108.1 hypothetical protein [Acidobacteriota bacterium]
MKNLKYRFIDKIDRKGIGPNFIATLMERSSDGKQAIFVNGNPVTGWHEADDEEVTGKWNQYR